MQLLIDWDKRDRDLASLRKRGGEAGLLPADIALLVSVATADVSRSATSYACKSKRQWALAMAKTLGTCSPNTPVAAMRRLAEAGVAAWEATPDGHAILVDWQLFWALPKAEPPSLRPSLEAALTAEKPALVRGVVRGGQASPRVLVDSSKARDTVYRDNVLARSSRSPAGIASRLDRPWSVQRGLRGDDLVWAIAERDRAVLHRLYYSAVEAGWWDDCEDYRVRFLTIAHHAIGADNPMALLTSLCRRDKDGEVLRSSRCRDESRDWASATRAHWRRQRDGVLASAEVERLEQPKQTYEEVCDV